MGKSSQGVAARRCIHRHGEDQPGKEHRESHAAPAKKPAPRAARRIFCLRALKEAAMGLFARFWHYSIGHVRRRADAAVDQPDPEVAVLGWVISQAWRARVENRPRPTPRRNPLRAPRGDLSEAGAPDSP